MSASKDLDVLRRLQTGPCPFDGLLHGDVLLLTNSVTLMMEPPGWRFERLGDFARLHGEGHVC